MGTKSKADEMAKLRDALDPHGMRFIGARSTTKADELDYDYNYAGTMLQNYGTTAKSAMAENGKYGPIMETEYNREEAPRRVWDDYSPPDYDYINKYLGKGASKEDGYDVWDMTQEDLSLSAVKSYSGFYNSRVGGTDGSNIYSAIAMMVWSDSNMHNRNTATENCRTSGRVDPIRQTKDSFYAVQAAQLDEPAVDILGHWSYPAVSNDTYNYYNKSKTDDTVYYTITLNGETMTLPVSAYEGLMDSVFAPVIPILEALKELGADFDYTYDDTTDPDDPKLTVTAGGKTIWCHTSENALWVDGVNDLPSDFPCIKDGVFCFEIAMILKYIDGVKTSQDTENHTYDITYTSGSAKPSITVDTLNSTSAKITVTNQPQNTVIYAAKYNEGVLTNIKIVNSGDSIDFMPDKVFLWKDNMEPIAMWQRQ